MHIYSSFNLLLFKLNLKYSPVTIVSVPVSALFRGWSLVEFRFFDHNNSDNAIYPLGIDAQGIITYTPEGVMSAHLTRPGAKPHEDANAPFGGSVEERARSMQHTMAYAGSYSVEKTPEPNRFIIRHRVTVSLFPNWVGSVQTRVATITGDRLVLEAQHPVGAILLLLFL